ncbi:MAG: glycoside hydrolase family 16 protein, partial [Clostridia bacterium]|nr:glycoside hydrolase family 16 protein [Clostridia bacterium]
MKRILSLFLSLLMIFSVLAVNGINAFAEETNTNETFLDIFKKNSTLAWHDEFEGNKVDETKWDIAKGWGRVEETWSTQEDGNVTVSDGCLKLRAYEKATSEFTNGKAKIKTIQSGEVSSLAAWSEGLIEVRAKLPKGKGVYPAIWTMGRDYTINSCSWPWSGEIDIMEAVGTANKDKANCSTWQTLHTSRPFKKIGGNANDAHVATGVGEYKTPYEVPLNDDFHTFWCYMDGSIMIIGVDEYMMNIKDLNDPNLACFKDWEQWLILGLQMGGLASAPERTDYSVWEMLVDYVRVYRLEDVEDYEKYQIFEA